MDEMMPSKTEEPIKQPTEKTLTVDRSLSDFERAYKAKSKLIKRELEDHKFALGDQWSKEDQETLRKVGIKAITDNRIAPNIFLVTGLERQNRSDFKAYPEGEEDSIKAEIASALFKNAIKTSGYSYKSSDQFKNGITCGESHLEPYLDYTENLLNGKPCWRQIDGNCLFPEPNSKEYDFSDCRYIYKIVLDISRGDLINLFPEKEQIIRNAKPGRLDFEAFDKSDETHIQYRDYPKSNQSSSIENEDEESFDLIERRYKKWVTHYYIGDKETGQIQEAENEEKANAFLIQYQGQIQANQQAFEGSVQQALAAYISQLPPEVASLPIEQHLQVLQQSGQMPPAPPPQDPQRFTIFKRQVPEIWIFSHVPGISEPLADEKAWFYPKWKGFGIVPFFGRFSTAPLTGEDRHLLVQGLVHGVKGVQEKHNKAEMLMLRHLNTTANSGWLSEEDSWVDADKVEQFGSAPGISLEYKKGRQPPQRIQPMVISTAHAAISSESAEAIKAQLGINADLLATQQGGTDSGRAIALRQRQGLLMVQELFDNLSRSRTIAGKFLLSQLGEMYDTETAKKVLGEAFLSKNFPAPMMLDVNGPDPMTGQPKQVPMTDPKTGQPMTYDKDMAEVAIAEVLAGDLGTYDVSVGEVVSSESQKMANSMEIKDFAQSYPGLIPPDLLIEESQLPQATKNKVLSSIKQAQAAQQAAAMLPPPGKPGKPPEKGLKP